MGEYRGRFAPSPTGPLHFGSLVAAVASYLDARANKGAWLVRMEDLDTPRCSQAHADSILADLEAFGFAWNEPVLYQSTRLDAYRDALETLKSRDLVYPCGCSRQDLVDERYPGTCANGLPPGKQARSWRVRTTGELAETAGDFVLLRADAIFAYQLAVVVDDAYQRITDVVRGADLRDSTPRQLYLQELLGYPHPRYAHVPVVLAADGQKLSKQTGAAALDRGNAGPLLRDALTFLGQTPPDLHTVSELWAWALSACASPTWSLPAAPAPRSS